MGTGNQRTLDASWLNSASSLKGEKAAEAVFATKAFGAAGLVLVPTANLRNAYEYKASTGCTDYKPFDGKCPDYYEAGITFLASSPVPEPRFPGAKIGTDASYALENGASDGVLDIHAPMSAALKQHLRLAMNTNPPQGNPPPASIINLLRERSLPPKARGMYGEAQALSSFMQRVGVEAAKSASSESDRAYHDDAASTAAAQAAVAAAGRRAAEHLEQAACAAGAAARAADPALTDEGELRVRAEVAASLSNLQVAQAKLVNSINDAPALPPGGGLHVRPGPRRAPVPTVPGQPPPTYFDMQVRIPGAAFPATGIPPRDEREEFKTVSASAAWANVQEHNKTRAQLAYVQLQIVGSAAEEDAWKKEEVEHVFVQIVDPSGRHHLVVAPAWRMAQLAAGYNSNYRFVLESRCLLDEKGVLYGTPPGSSAGDYPNPPFHSTHTDQLLKRLVYEYGFVYVTWWEY